MPRDARFWRNVTIISVAHIAIIVALVRWNREARPNLQSIVWMSGGLAEAAGEPALAQTETPNEKMPLPETLRSKPEREDEPRPTPSKSDLQLPPATPSPAPLETPIPKPSTTPVSNPSPKVTPKATPKPARKKPVAATATPKPLPKKKATSAEQEKKNDEDREETKKIAPSDATVGDGDKSSLIGPRGAVRASEFNWYGKMLHDRFYSEWIQPKTSTAIGAKISAIVRIRIEKDGRISNFTIAKPSGNVVVDESVAAVGKRVTQVDPLPMGLGNGSYYEVNINFELNPEP